MAQQELDISLDSRAARTLAALLARPGFLTNAYLRGRRKRFVPPLRLFLFTRLICIFSVWLLNLTGDRELIVSSGGLLTQNGELSPEQRERIGQRLAHDRLEQLDPAERAEIEEKLEVLETVLQRRGRVVARDDTAGDGDDGFTVALPWLSEADNRQLEARLEKSIAKISDDPDDFVSELLENIPQTTLLLVPLFALLMKLAYPFTGRYYVEHLIHALHAHAFLFLTALMLIGLDLGESRLAATASGPLQLLGRLLALIGLLLVSVLLVSVLVS